MAEYAGCCGRCGNPVVAARSAATGARLQLDAEPKADGQWRLDSGGYAVPSRVGDDLLSPHQCWDWTTGPIPPRSAS